MKNPNTKQGVKNLNDLGPKKAPKPCPPHIASDWKEEEVFPNSPFDDWDFMVLVKRKRCVSCRKILEEDFGRKYYKQR